MQSTYSNYDSDSFIYGSKNRVGGLNPNQEFRPQPQPVGAGAGLLISVKSDVIGKVFVDFTNIIEEPYAIVEIFELKEEERENGVISKNLLVSVKAKNFRIRFRNGSSLKQNTLKLFTFILPSSPVVSLNPDTLPFKVDLSGLLITTIRDSSGNPIYSTAGKMNTNSYLNDGNGNKINSIITNTDNSVRSLYVHNQYDYSYNNITFLTDTNNIYSTVFQLNKYKNFDVMFESITATNYAPVRLYVYISKDNNIFMKSDYYIDIYYGDTSRILTNVTVNGDYIKLQGKKISGLTINTCYIVTKG
jgi:hypothetical protein